jgi:hypothetical protein
MYTCRRFQTVLMNEAMTKNQFVELTLNDKIELVIDRGVELLNRVFLFYIIRLYSVDGFYVEVWYRTSANRIDRIDAVELEEVFHLYEKSINIEDLFKK